MDKMTGLIMIKPDGVERQIEENLVLAMRDAGIKIVAERERLLTVSEIRESFFCNYDLYVQYLSSGLCKAFLVSYYDKDDLLYTFKNEFRRIWLKDYKKTHIKNLIHTSDEGLEFFKQSKLFFSDIWLPDFCQGSDLLISNIHDERVRREIKRSRLSNLGILIQTPMDYTYAQELSNNYNIICVIKRELVYMDKQIVLYDYHRASSKIDYPKMFYDNKNVITVLGEIYNLDKYGNRDVYKKENPLEFYELVYGFYKKQLSEIIKSIGVKIQGILIETSNMDLWEANSRYFYAEENNYLMVSGSNNSDNIGKFFSSKQMYAEVMNCNV